MASDERQGHRRVSMQELAKQQGLRPQESLLSLLYRHSDVYHYEPHGVLVSYLQQKLTGKGIRDRVVYPLLPETFQALSDLTGLDQTQIVNATLHRFARILTFPGKPMSALRFDAEIDFPLLAPLAAQTHTYSHLGTQYCPCCLRENLYHRLAWSLLCVTLCLEHTCLLIKRCPGCGHPVSVRDVTYDECKRCGYRLSAADPAPIALDELDGFAQQTIQAWFDLCELPATSPYLPLPEAEPQALYHFLFTLQGFMCTQRFVGFSQRTVGDHPQRIPAQLSKLETPASALHTLFTLALSVVTQWPTEFHRLLKAYRKQPDPLDEGGLRREFGGIYSWLQRHQHEPAFAFVQQALDDFLAERYDTTFHIRKSPRYRHRPEMAAKFQHLTYSEAARLLRLPPTALRLLVESGRLARYRSSDSTHYLFRREEVEALDASWGAEHPLADVARSLELGVEVVVDLIRMGLLSESPITDDNLLPSTVNGRYLDLFLLVLSKFLRSHSVSEQDVLDFNSAAYLLATQGARPAYLLDRVLHGAVSAFHASERLVQPGTLMYSAEDVRACMMTLGTENRWLQPYQIASRMRVKEQVVWRWRQLGLITPAAYAANRECYDIDQINKFEREHVSEREAARILRVTTFTLGDWAFAGKLHPVSGPSVDGSAGFLFRKEEILALREHSSLASQSVLPPTSKDWLISFDKGEMGDQETDLPM